MRARHLFVLATLTATGCVLFFTAMADAKSMTMESPVRAVHLSKSVPGQLNYQGFLVDATDSSAITSTLQMTFRLFDSETKGAELWSETHPAVEVNDGNFHVLLGSFTAFPAGLFDGSTLWLQTEVGTEILAPRKPLVSVAYSQRAEMADHASTAYDADHLEGQSLTDLDGRWVNQEDLDHLDASDGDPTDALSVDHAGKVGIGTTSPLTELDVNGSVNATTYYGDGSHLTGISGTTDNDWVISPPDIYTALAGKVGIGVTHPTRKLEVNGDVMATTYYGDGSHLTGISAADDDWIINGDDIHHETGNVGIGTTSPTSKLDVSGDVNVDSLYRIRGDAVLSATDSINILVGIAAGENNTGEPCTFLGYRAGKDNQGGYNTFIGDHVGGINEGHSNTYIGSQAGFNNTTGNSNTFVGRSTGRANSTGRYNTFVGDLAGFINSTGIGNTFLGKSAGYYAIGDSNVFVGHWAGYYETGSNKLYIANDRYDSNVLIYGDFSTRRVGIGTLSPSQSLHIAGHEIIQGPDGFDSSGDQATLYLGDTAKYLRATYGGNTMLYSNDPISIRTFADSSQLHLKTNGRVGVGTDNPTRKFWVNGDAGGTGAWYNDSDVRLKQDISTIEGALDKVQRLRGVNFRWREMKHHPEGKQVGLIAQEVQEVVPEVVDKKGQYYSLATANLVPVLIEAVKEQQEIIERLESRIEVLESAGK